VGRDSVEAQNDTPSDRSRRRVLLVGPLPPPIAGVEIMTQNILAAGSKLRGWEVRHCNTSKGGDLSTKGSLNATNVGYIVWHWLKFVGSLFSIRPNIVHLPLSQNLPGFLRDTIFVLSGALLKRRILLHFHGGDFQRFLGSRWPPLRPAIKWVLRRSTRIAVLGEALRGQFSGLVPDERILVMPNSIHAPASLGTRVYTVGSATVLFLGKISAAKGAVDFVTAADLILSRHRDLRIQFVLVGESLDVERNVTFVPSPHGAMARISALMAHDWCRGAITLHPPVVGEGKWNLYRSSDIFVLPSYSEGMPLTLVEAMWAGLPIVASRVGAIEETLPISQSPFLIQPGDTESLADRILELYRDPDRRAALGWENQKVATENYGLEQLTTRLEHAYNLTSGSFA
jgi:glycosyltransferase involved in cell wall biosynthesis